MLKDWCSHHDGEAPVVQPPRAVLNILHERKKVSPLFFPKNLVKNWKKSRDFALHSKAGFRGSQFFGNFRGNRKTTEVNFSLVLSFVW